MDTGTGYGHPYLDRELDIACKYLGERLNWSPRVFAKRQDSLDRIARPAKVAHLQHAHRELRALQVA